MLFDTGSAGVTLDALTIFPSDVVDQSGFKFKNGQDTIRYKNIIITKINVKKVYGSSSNIETLEIGNLGYANLSVGDAQGSLTTLKMPILFYYKTLSNGLPINTGLGSVFGVNTIFNEVQSMSDTTQIFQLVSPLKYLVYNNGLTAGYKLDAFELNGCAIQTEGSCPSNPVFTAGLNSSITAGYNMIKLTQIISQNSLSIQWFPPYPTFKLFDPNIYNASIGTAYRRKSGKVLLDTGNPGVLLNANPDSLRIYNNPVVSLNLPSGDMFTYNSNNADFKTTFSPASTRSAFGIYFFTKFSFLEDYENGVIGLKIK